MLTLPVDAISTITTYINGVLNDFMPLILLILGITWGLWFMQRLPIFWYGEEKGKDYFKK